MRDISNLSKEELFSDDTVRELLGDEKTIAEFNLALIPYAERSKELKCATQFSSFVKASQKEKKRYISTHAQTLHQDNEPMVFEVNGREFSLNAPGFKYIDGSIYKEVPSIYNNLVCICNRPMFPTKTLINVKDSTVKVKVCYLDAFMKWQQKTFGAEVVSNSRSISQLNQYGIDVTSETAKDIVKLMTEFRERNIDTIARGYSSSAFGWHRFEDRDIFLPYDTQIEFDGYERFKSLTDSLEPRGDYDKWFMAVADMRASGRKEPLVYLVAAFASVLLKPLNMLPFIVNLWTATGRGKTVALMMACSVWANPEEGNFLTDPTSTKTALEQRLSALNNLPMMIDDLSKMKAGNEEDFANMIYFLCAGKGKERSNVNLGVEVTPTWKTVIMTNMERPLAENTSRGGAINRILDFESEQGSYFTNPKGEDIGNKVVDVVKNNYGFAGRMFVEIIKNIPPTELKERFDRLKEVIREKSADLGVKKEEKQIAPMALMLLTSELIENEIFQDGVVLDVDWCVSQLKNVDEVSEDSRAYETLMEVVAANRFTHFGLSDLKDTDLAYKVTEKWGFIDIANDLVCLYGNSFDMISKKWGFSKVSLSKWCKANNLLVCDDNDKRLTKKRYDITSGQIFNMYCFKMKSGGEINLTNEDVNFLLQKR